MGLCCAGVSTCPQASCAARRVMFAYHGSPAAFKAAAAAAGCVLLARGVGRWWALRAANEAAPACCMRRCVAERKSSTASTFAAPFFKVQFDKSSTAQTKQTSTYSSPSQPIKRSISRSRNCSFLTRNLPPSFRPILDLYQALRPS